MAYCCPGGTVCEIPPGCPGTASSCGDTAGDGRNDHCTFLNVCGDAGVPMDAGAPDSGSADAGTADGGTSDGGSKDGGASADGGAVETDAGASDAGTTDGGAPGMDAGSTDDAGTAPRDGGGTMRDGGAPPRMKDGGCGCSVPGRAHDSRTPLALLLGLGLLVRARRRRGGTPRARA